MFEIDNLSKYRMDLSSGELRELVLRIEEFNKEKKLDSATLLVEKLSFHLNNGKEVKYSHKKQKAATNATKLRVKKAKEKIENAVNILRMENKKISEYAVAKVSGCSINTVKKYRDFINGQQVMDL